MSIVNRIRQSCGVTAAREAFRSWSSGASARHRAKEGPFALATTASRLAQDGLVTAAGRLR
jgi:hypothetical protein